MNPRAERAASADLGALITESRNPRSDHIDELATADMLALINEEDARVPGAVREQIPAIAQAVDGIAERFRRGGRLIYAGAGTSGRLGVLDASECPPTFSVPPTLVQGLIAGGDAALRLSSESAEDSEEQGALDLADRGLTAADTVVGIAASGRTPYVLGALRYAREAGALTVGLACVPGSPVADASAIAITPVVGPEVLAGSTRMKAGTATKLVLNMLSTGVMIRTGATLGNLMVNVRATNRKLQDRARRIVIAATGCGPEQAEALLRESGGDVKTAIVMETLGLPYAAATARVKRAQGVLRRALER